MKRVSMLPICFFTVFWSVSSSQSYLPSLPTVAREFFTNYSHMREEENDRVYFAKKKQGWYVQVIDQLHTDHVKSEQLFWDINESRYKPLTGFGPGLTEEEVAAKIVENIRSNYGFYTYGFERCRYFGYNEWDADMIEDFGAAIPENDTLLEGLARAYIAYAKRFLGQEVNSPLPDNDPLKTRLGQLDIPGKERVAQFLAYSDKAIACYRVLAERNPGYMTLIGTVEMKQVNEEFHQYQQLSILGYTQEAEQALARITPNNIYSQIGHAYLNACPPNSILFTSGDNDTYSAWYVQAKEGYRKDVTVLNQQLLNILPYLTMHKKNKHVSFSTSGDFFKKPNPGYFYFMNNPGKPAEISLPLSTFIEDLQKGKNPPVIAGDTVPSYTTKAVLFDIDLPRLKKICPQSNLTTTMDFQLQDYLTLSDFMILDILKTNLYTRPVCTTWQIELFQSKYLQQQGSVYRVLPIDESDPDAKTRIEINKTKDFLLKNYKPVIGRYGNQNNENMDRLYGLHSRLFSSLISGYISLKDTTKAKYWASRYIAHPDLKELVPEFSDMQLAQALLHTGHNDKAIHLLERLAQKLAGNYRRYSALEYYQSRDELIGTLQYFGYMLREKNISSDILEKLIADINEKDE